MNSVNEKLKRLEILNRVHSYMNKHPMAGRVGGEYVNQDDEAQIDAIELVCDLADVYCNYNEDIEVD